MEKMKKSKIQKWDEVNGMVEEDVEETGTSYDEAAGVGPSISRNPMKGIEDQIEQNDNNLDGIINNLPETKPITQMNDSDVIEEEQKKKSVRERIRKSNANPKKIRNNCLCPERELCFDEQ